MTLQRKTIISAFLVELTAVILLIASVTFLNIEPHGALHRILFWLSVIFSISGATGYVIAGRYMRPATQLTGPIR